MTYLKCFESFLDNVGGIVTFVAKYVPHGVSYGSGFIVQKRNEMGKWLGNIDCKEGTEITGTIIELPKLNSLLKFYKLKLEDGSIVTIDTQLFDKKKETL